MSRTRRGLAACALLALAWGDALGQEPTDPLERVRVRVRYVSAGAVYLDRGRGAGIAVGDPLLVTLDDGQEERLQVVAVAERSASAALTNPRLAERIQPGQTAVVLARRREAQAEVAPVTTRSAGPGRGAAAGEPDGLWQDAEPAWGERTDEPFRPLLAPVATPEATQARKERDAFLLDGRLTLSAFRVEDTEVGRAWSRLRAYADVELSRIEGTDWRAVLRTSANAQLEEGRDDSYQLRIHEAYVEHQPRELTHRVRFGRFFFEPLPAVGQLDGAHGELKLGASPVYVGAATGLLGTATYESPDYHRAGGVLYVTLRSDPREESGADVSLGYYASVDSSRFDRSAILARENVRLFNRVFLSGLQTVDLYDTDDYRAGQRLTRGYLDLRVQLVRQLALGAGYDRNELADTYASRELYAGLTTPGDTRAERYYVYASQRLDPGWSFSQRVAYVVRRRRKRQTALTLSASKLGVFDPGDSVRVGYYGLLGGETETHSPYLELTKALPAGWSVWWRYRLQLLAPPLGGDLTQHELSLGATWVHRRLFLSLEGSYTTGDEVERYRGYASLTWRF